MVQLERRRGAGRELEEREGKRRERPGERGTSVGEREEDEGGRWLTVRHSKKED